MKGKHRVSVVGLVGHIASFMSVAVMTMALMLWSGMFIATHATESASQERSASLTKAVFADHRLWLLSDAGDLSAVDDAGDRRISQHLSGPALDLCVHDGHPAVITDSVGSLWTLYGWIDQKWQVITTVASEGDHFVTINCHGSAETILTSKRLLVLEGNRVAHAVSLSKPWRHGPVSASYGDGRYFFVAINAGEWGGGLTKIDEDSGQIVSVEKNATGQLCGGPLNSECDPVNGIAVEPWNNHCLAVAVGLVHMMGRGRIVEVCGDAIRTLYSKSITSSFSNGLSQGRPAPKENVAFFGLTSSGGALWAVGVDGLYQIDWRSTATMTPLPRFKTIGGVDVSFDIPGLVLVMTSANERRSVSGRVPMLVPR